MELKITSLTDGYVKQISTWRYAGQYEIYNTPSYKDMVDLQFSLTLTEKRNNYIAFVNENNKLVGYMNIVKNKEPYVFVGIGLAPEFCGQGIGKQVLKLGMQKAIERYFNHTFYLQVRSWNVRAIKCYESVGFKIVKKQVEPDYTGQKPIEYYYMELEV